VGVNKGELVDVWILEQTGSDALNYLLSMMWTFERRGRAGGVGEANSLGRRRGGCLNAEVGRGEEAIVRSNCEGSFWAQR
jgi:hypothetical protein